MGCSFTDSIADCGSYSKEIVETIDAHSNLFYLRASNCESAYTEFAELDGWKTIEINYQKCEVCSLKFNRFMEEKGYRLVIQRTRIEHESDLFGDTFSYVYRCILTNDWGDERRKSLNTTTCVVRESVISTR